MVKSESPRVVFTVGGTVQAGGGFYIPRRADQELLSLCHQGEFAYVLTPRQMGKSSLMVRTAESLSQAGIRSVLIDLSQIGVKLTDEQWYLGLLTIIEEQLSLETDVVKWWDAHRRVGITQRLTDFFQEVLLRELQESVVIFVDEIDSTLSLNFTDDFYAAIRFFHNARAYVNDLHRLSFVLIGVATPEDLIRDPQRTPFNIGQRVDLTDFNLEEALPLADGLGLPADEARQVIEWVLKWTGGHPYLTQRLCRVISKQAGSRWDESAIDELVHKTFLGRMSQEDHNLVFVRDMLTKRAAVPGEVLSTYREIRHSRHHVADDEQSTVKSHLKLSGIVCRKDGALQVRNRIYREVFNEGWIKEHLPINWTKRLVRYAAFAIAALVIVSAFLTPWALSQKSKAERQSREAEAQSRKADEQRLIAEEQERIANEQRQSAEGFAEEAQMARNLAEQERRKAEQAAAIATASESRARKAEAEQRLAALSEAAAKERAEQNALIAQNAQEVEGELRHHAEAAAAQALDSESKALAAQQNEADQRKEAETQTIRAQKAEAEAKRSLALVAELDEGVPYYGGGILRGNNNFSNGLAAPGSQQMAAKAAAFAPDGKRIAMLSADKKVSVGEIKETRKEPVTANTDKWPETVLAFIADNNQVFAVNDKKAWLWDVNTGKELPFLEGYKGSNKNTAISPDGKLIFVVGEDGQGRILEASTRKEIRTLEKKLDAVYKVVFSKNGERVFTAHRIENNKSEGYVWDAKSGKLLSYLKPSDKMIDIAMFSPGLDYLAAVSDKRASVWRINQERPASFQSERKGHEGKINSLDFNHNGGLIVTASNDGMAWVWNARTGKKISELRGHRGVLITSQKGKLLSGDWRALHSFHFLKDILPVSFENLRRRDLKHITSAVFNPKSDLVVTTSETGAVNLWEAQTGKLIMELRGHTKSVNSATFSQDGKLIITASDDGTARVWDICATNKALRLDQQSKDSTSPRQNEAKEKEKTPDLFEKFKALKQLCSDK